MLERLETSLKTALDVRLRNRRHTVALLVLAYEPVGRNRCYTFARAGQDWPLPLLTGEAAAPPGAR